uniref:Transmembrane protein n=1 Tax=Heterorhabditis bacteriophora TaxID=37862 RepID=A0A1I7WCR0_HETBA
MEILNRYRCKLLHVLCAEEQNRLKVNSVNRGSCLFTVHCFYIICYSTLIMIVIFTLRRHYTSLLTLTLGVISTEMGLVGISTVVALFCRGDPGCERFAFEERHDCGEVVMVIDGVATAGGITSFRGRSSSGWNERPSAIDLHITSLANRMWSRVPTVHCYRRLQNGNTKQISLSRKNETIQAGFMLIFSKCITLTKDSADKSCGMYKCIILILKRAPLDQTLLISSCLNSCIEKLLRYLHIFVFINSRYFFILYDSQKFQVFHHCFYLSSLRFGDMFY